MPPWTIESKATATTTIIARPITSHRIHRVTTPAPRDSGGMAMGLGHGDIREQRGKDVRAGWLYP